MGSWREELDRREAATSERVEALRRQIAELSEQLEVAEQRLSRLQITRETMDEILGERTEVDDQHVRTAGPDSVDDMKGAVSQHVPGAGRMIGAVLVPQRVAGMDPAAVLPEDYGEILAVLAEAADGLRAGRVAAELGIETTDRAKVEGLRSKLKRLVARGWADQQPSGKFMIANEAGVVGD
ncbi:hypothetical protein HLB23_40705 [Nocardia uniformis]|uniref:Uncharacterized protein n=1 Tax=Nocardia uniformis TaxID=53432 RepID=A0A849CB68_9NOCA|nr:hypothetical protein [Nocardia uniformis]NNH76093.1 hypothetical protein [Nocardia uniformis]